MSYLPLLQEGVTDSTSLIPTLMVVKDTLLNWTKAKQHASNNHKLFACVYHSRKLNSYLLLYTSRAPSPHQLRTSSSPAPHQLRTSSAPAPHQLHTSSTPAPHQLLTSSATALHQHCTSSSPAPDRKSTRLNSSHTVISYAVFCLKKKNITFDHFFTPH